MVGSVPVRTVGRECNYPKWDAAPQLCTLLAAVDSGRIGAMRFVALQRVDEQIVAAFAD